MIYDIFSTRFGDTLICAKNDALCGLYFIGQKYQALVQPEWQQQQDDALLREVRAQFKAYERSGIAGFDLPLDPQGTEFQKRVWTALLSIPVGTTCTYGHIAQMAANMAAVRAVGSAIGKNPISIIIPCHRVVGSNGSLTGYAGGLSRKAALLQHEGASFVGMTDTPDLFA
jgi:methylated-DNA-[protein]-cysteine S-methyltransferase